MALLPLLVSRQRAVGDGLDEAETAYPRKAGFEIQRLEITAEVEIKAEMESMAKTETVVEVDTTVEGKA